MSLRAGVVSAREAGETRRRAARLQSGAQERDRLLEALVAERDALRPGASSQQSADGVSSAQAAEPPVAEAPPTPPTPPAPTIIGLIDVEMLEEHPRVPGTSVLWIDELARALPEVEAGVRGVGSRLLYEALAGFEARLGALPDVVQLHVDVGNAEAIRWYVGRGFELVRFQVAAKALEAHERAEIPAAPDDALPVHCVELNEGGEPNEGPSRRSSRLDPQRGKPLAYCLQAGGAALWRRLSRSTAVLGNLFDDCVRQFTLEELRASPATWDSVKQLVDDILRLLLNLLRGRRCSRCGRRLGLRSGRLRSFHSRFFWLLLLEGVIDSNGRRLFENAVVHSRRLLCRGGHGRSHLLLFGSRPCRRRSGRFALR